MMRKLDLDALRADLTAVTQMMREADENGDPVGKLQWAHRRSEIETELQRLLGSPAHTAGVALFFGGSPVIGSQGIKADFAGRSLETFQDLISKRFAMLEGGDMGSRGPIRFKPCTQMMVTDVARGSFGFMLEEAAENETLTDTPLKHAVDDISRLVVRVTAPDAALFEEAVEEMDPRMLGALRDFFRNLDDAAATLRLVEGERDVSFSGPDIHRARLRTEETEIREMQDDTVIGKLIGLIPSHRKFELRRSGTGDVIYGAVAADLSKSYQAELDAGTGNPIGRTWRTRMKVREVTERNRPLKRAYTLVGLLQEIADSGVTSS